MKYLFLFVCLSLSFSSFSQNQTNQSFNKAKKMLDKSVYVEHRITLYCEANFDFSKNVIHPAGFQSLKYKKRSKKLNGNT
jgi:deoxyribonuclease-1